MPSRIQTFLFDKRVWSAATARLWLAEHDFANDKLDDPGENARFLRFRQFDPERCDGGFVVLTQNFPDGVQATACVVAESAAANIHEATLLKANVLWREDEPRRRALCPAVTRLVEGAYQAEKGIARVAVIEAGANKSRTREYPPTVLKRDLGIFEGIKMYADHQTEAERRERPEGSVRNWVASLKNVSWSEQRQRLEGDAVLIDPAFKAKLEELSKHGLLSQMGMSIRAIGEGHQRDGAPLLVEKLVAARSVDFVTEAGAGGQVEALESDREIFTLREAAVKGANDVDLISLEELTRRRPDLIELVEAGRGEKGEKTNMTIEQLQEQVADFKQKLDENQRLLGEATRRAETSETERDTLKKRVEASEQRERIAQAKVHLETLLSECDPQLPEATQIRLRKRFEGVEATEGMKAAIEDEQKYLAEVGAPKAKSVKATGKPGVRDLGESYKDGEGYAPDFTKRKERFVRAGLTEKQAEIAARGV